MRFFLLQIVVAYIALLSGCRQAKDIELSKANAEAEGAKAEAAKLRAENQKKRAAAKKQTRQESDLSELARAKGHKGNVTFVSFSKDGSLAVSADSHGFVRVWDGKSLKEVLQIEANRGRGVTNPGGRASASSRFS